MSVVVNLLLHPQAETIVQRDCLGRSQNALSRYLPEYKSMDSELMTIEVQRQVRVIRRYQCISVCVQCRMLACSPAMRRHGRFTRVEQRSQLLIVLS